MSYCLVNTDARPLRVVCRAYSPDYTARDYTGEVLRDYFGRYHRSDMLTWDTPAAAHRYADFNGLTSWHVFQHDPCCCRIIFKEA